MKSQVYLHNEDTIILKIRSKLTPFFDLPPIIGSEIREQYPESFKDFNLSHEETLYVTMLNISNRRARKRFRPIIFCKVTFGLHKCFRVEIYYSAFKFKLLCQPEAAGCCPDHNGQGYNQLGRNQRAWWIFSFWLLQENSQNHRPQMTQESSLTAPQRC